MSAETAADATSDDQPKAPVPPPVRRAPWRARRRAVRLRLHDLGLLRLTVAASFALALGAATYGPFVPALIGVGAGATTAADGVAARQALEHRVDRVEAALEAAGTMKPASDGMSSARAANIVAAVQLVSAAVVESAPYDVELVVAYAMVGEDTELMPILDELRPRAEGGIPSTSRLQATFPARIADAARLVSADGGVLGSVTGTLSGAVRMMGFGNASPHDIASGHLETALDLVEAGQIGLAVALVEKLDGPARNALEPWRQDAADRLAAEAALERLRRVAFNQVLSAEW